MAAVRLRGILPDFGDSVAVHWRGFPLLPHHLPGNRVSPCSVQGRARAAEAESACGITPWSGDGYPTSSLPALEAARCAARQCAEAFDGFDMALFRAFFSESRDISDRDVLLGLADGVGLDTRRLAWDMQSGVERQALLEEYHVARDEYSSMALGIPFTVINGSYPLTGALPADMYRHAVQRALSEN